HLKPPASTHHHATPPCPGVNLALRPGRTSADAARSPSDTSIVEKTRMVQQEFLLNSSLGRRLDLTSGIYLYYNSARFAPLALVGNAFTPGLTSPGISLRCARQ